MKTGKRSISLWLCLMLLVSAAGGFPLKVSADEAAAAAGGTGSTPAVVTQIAGGKGFTVLLKQDGTVWTLGDNLRGKLGGGLEGRKNPAPVNGLTDVTAIAAGQSHTLALKKDGTVWAWGQNTYGQLGNGTNVDQNTPVQIAGLQHITAISAGNFHSVALQDDGTVWTWGDNTYGQLGDSTTDSKNKPVHIQGNMTGIKSIASGAYHNLAIDGDGVVWGWGDNYFGELGYGYDQNHLSTPIMATSQSWKITQIAAGLDFSLAVKDDGTLLTWGLMSKKTNAVVYSHGNSINYDEHKIPVLVNGIQDVTQILAGTSFAAALTKDGTMYTWGDNSAGQLGTGTDADGKTWDRTLPNPVNGISDIARIGVGPNFTFAISKDNKVTAWGNNSYGQLGDGTNNNQPSPIATNLAEALNPVIAKPGEGPVLIHKPRSSLLAAGDSDTFAIQNNSLYGWGTNTYGQLGSGTNDSSQSAQHIALQDAVSVSAGNSHTLAVKADGTLWSWGQNYFGQLGDGTTANRNAPAQVSSLSGVVAAAAGSNHSIALLGNGTVWSFGDNTYGQLGHDASAAPAAVSSLTDIVAIAAGANFNLALQNSGTIWSWGDNTNGQLGDGTFVGKQQPVQITGVTGVVAIAAGKNHALALKNDGTVWAWGYDAFGQLGDGGSTNQNKPVQVAKLNHAIAIAAGAYHSLAINEDGSVWAWGQNSFGQLGDGTTSNRSEPVQAKGIAAASAIAAGGGHSAALLKDGSVWTWGGNYSGQLGDGTRTNRSAPNVVTGLTSATFNDIAGHWAEKEILAAAAKGYVDGYADGSFGPDRTVTRAEFLKLEAGALQVTAANAAAGSAWYQPYVDAAQKSGLLQDGDLQAGWDQPITRREIATLADRAVVAEWQKPNTGLQSKEAMLKAVQTGILQGLDNGDLAPDAATTRAQAVIVLERIQAVKQGTTLPTDAAAIKQAEAAAN